MVVYKHTIIEKERLLFTSYAMLAMEIIEDLVLMMSNQYRINGLDVNDVAQELRLHIWRKLDKYDPNKASFKTWARRVMRNKLTDLAGRKESYKDMLDGPERSLYDENLIDDDTSYISVDG